MPKRRKQKLTNLVDRESQITDQQQISTPLQLLAKKRIGGAVNLKGIHFQVLFAIHTLLIRSKMQNQSFKIWVEGVEDIDVYVQNSGKLFQIKTSQNNIDASRLWNMNVLQNFFEAFKISETLAFCLVHNTTLSKNKLEGFGTDNISDDTLIFWLQKFIKDGFEITKDELKTFLGRITLLGVSEQELEFQIKQQLFEAFNINPGAESTFFQALFQWVFEASRNRKVISHVDLIAFIQSVKDSFSTFPINPALQNNWISLIPYQMPDVESDFGYYDGKAARPADIVRKLPVPRLQWEKRILESIEKFDITVIKSSSGQGKSTLAWQIGYVLKNKNFSIYQLHYCKDYNEANAITDFIHSRITIGQVPIIVIDGITQNLSAWDELAKKLRDMPVKILITTREEDWVRFGHEAASSILNIIDIKLTVHEAQLIYTEIFKAGRLHPSSTEWEPMWEKVKEKGLMIEYIFLLTRGQMISERISHQISILITEQGSPAKLEILRLISLADVLSLRLRTQNLSDHIQGQIGFTVDRNEVYRQLEKEYYLRFDDTYVEGLHPVRSEHLVKLLHSHIPIETSLINLLKIIDEAYVYDFFINAPLKFESIRANTFYKEAAAIMASRTIPEMVYAIDGLMHLEPYLYWQQNKQLFDIAYERGGLDIFVSDTTPFTKLQTIEKLSESITGDQGSNVRFLLEKQRELSPYSVNNSALFQFSLFLKSELDKKGSVNSFEGLTFLLKWFTKLGISFPDIITIDEAELLNILETKEIGESSDIFLFYSILNPAAYRTFVAKHQDVIIGWIKKKTNTLTIYEEAGDIHIHYLLDNNHDRVNDLSVYRINIVHSFLPDFAHYCTKAIILPFPNADLHKAILQNSVKRMSPDTLALGNNFDVHINQIWSKTILDQYGANSIYEWQKQYFQIRTLCLELYKKFIRLLEAHLEKNSKKVKSISGELASMSTEFFKLDNGLKKYPSTSKKYFDQKAYSEQLQSIGKWLSSFRNFMNQCVGLIRPESSRDRHLPLINIQDTVYYLDAMQKAYNFISDDNYNYFPTDQLSLDETKWLHRLLDTVEFYIVYVTKQSSSNIVAASKEVDQWKLEDEREKLKKLHTVIYNFESDFGYKLFPPSKITRERRLRYAVIGLRGCDTSNEDELWNLSTGLSDLATTDIDFFTFLLVDDNNQVTGAFRVGQQYFEKFQQLLNGIVEEDSSFGNLIPLIPDETMLSTISGLTLKKVTPVSTNDAFFKMMFDIWKLCEHRKRLNPSIRPEKLFLQQAETEYHSLIMQSVSVVFSSNGSDSPISQERIDKILRNESSIEMEEICDIMLDKARSIQQQSA